MKKILLLSTNRATLPYPVPPLGLACLYHRLNQNYNVKLIDGFKLSSSEIPPILKDFQPDYVGISIRNIDDMVKDKGRSFIPQIMKDYLEPMRKYHKGPLILGGSGFTIFPQELMELSNADYGIIGEAEQTFPRLLQCLEDHGDAILINGVLARAHKKFTRPGQEDYMDLTNPFDSELDILLDYSVYQERGAYPIQTKRGCVHRCIYCSYPFLEGRRFRLRNIHHVVDEIEATSKRMACSERTFEFVDSTFNDPPGHADTICQEIINRGLKVRLRTMGMNPVNITHELLQLMRRAGFAQIDATPDSASPSMLVNLQKNFTLDHLVRAADYIRRNNMPTMWFFIFGGPGENEKTIQETFSFIDRYIDWDDMVHITEGLRIYPHTSLHQTAITEGVINETDSLLEPSFYISPQLGWDKLERIIHREIGHRPNCVRMTETEPPTELLKAAMKERKEKKLDEPVFRTLIRLKRELFT